MPGSITSARNTSAHRSLSRSTIHKPAEQKLFDQQTLDRLMDRILIAPAPAADAPAQPQSARDAVDAVCGVTRHQPEGGAR